MLENLVPRIIGNENSFRIHSYKGIGRIPSNMKDCKNANHRILMENLPKVLKGFGRTQAALQASNPFVVIVVCDLDNNCLHEFRNQLLNILYQCNPMPDVRFCIAVEEGESWLLGDPSAIRAAYPNIREDIINHYIQDSICGTWELLADAIYSGGSQALKEKGWQSIGMEKSTWAKKITPYMTLDRNNSASFNYFKNKLIGSLNC